MNAIPRDGLVLELLFNGDARDTSGHHHHGVVLGAVPTEDRFGRAASAYFFDGIDDHITVDPPPRLSDSALTVSAWVRADAIDRGGWSSAVVCQDNGNDEDQSRRVFQLSTVKGRAVWHMMQGAHDPTARKFLPVGEWTHLAAVVDRGVHSLYVNGELNDTVRHLLRAHAIQPLHVGRKGTDEPFFFFRGAIDDVRVYERALADAEVAALFHEDGFSAPPPRLSAPPISGLWETENGNKIDLWFDGRTAITGTITAGHPGNVAAISHGTFDPKTGALTLDGVALHPWKRAEVPYHVEGRLTSRQLDIQAKFGADEASVSLRKVTLWRKIVHRLRKAGGRVLHQLEPLLVPLVRAKRARLRRSKAENLRALGDRGESLASFAFRDATAADIPKLAALHVKTWAMTYPEVKRPPTFAIREWQWREAFEKNDGNWFGIVIERPDKELIGFAKGIVRPNGHGDLNKIYLLWEYHRLGLGHRLVGHVVRRFMSQGVTTMTLHADASNPTCAFYEAIGGEVQRDDRGRPQPGAYIWRDLPALAAVCPLDAARADPMAVVRAQ